MKNSELLLIGFGALAVVAYRYLTAPTPGPSRASGTGASVPRDRKTELQARINELVAQNEPEAYMKAAELRNELLRLEASTSSATRIRN